MDQNQLIEKLNLNKKQAIVYLSLLEFGASTITQIAQNTQLKRTSVYLLVEKLTQQELVRVNIYKKTKYYEAVSSDELIEIQKNKLKQLEEVKPLLDSLTAQPKQKPEITFFEGKTGIQKIYNDTLTAQTNIIGCSVPDIWTPVLGNFCLDYIQRRVAKKIPAFGFIPDNQISINYSKKDSSEMRATKKLDIKKFPISNEINIYDDKVAIMSLKPEELFGVIIKSKEVAATLRSIFKLAWENYKK